MKLVDYRGSLRGVKRLRLSKEIDADLEKRAQRMADAARSAYASLGVDIEVVVAFGVGSDPTRRRPRVRAAVYAGGPSLQIEAKHRVLGGSLDAARG